MTEDDHHARTLITATRSLWWQIAGVVSAALIGVAAIAVSIAVSDPGVAWMSGLFKRPAGNEAPSSTTATTPYRLIYATALRRIPVEHDDTPVAVLKVGDRVILLNEQDTGKWVEVRSMEGGNRTGYVPRDSLERMR